MSQRGFVYHVSKNGADGDWYWEVTCDGWIIGRGLATTEAKSRAAALAAALSYEPYHAVQIDSQSGAHTVT
jgi:hypothetical protein